MTFPTHTRSERSVQCKGGVVPKVQHDLNVREDTERVDLVAWVALLSVPHRLVILTEGGGLVTLLAPSEGDIIWSFEERKPSNSNIRSIIMRKDIGFSDKGTKTGFLCY